MILAIIIIFVVGYFFIAIEEIIEFNKTSTALITGVLCWVIYAIFSQNLNTNELLAHHFESTAEILFFLLGAMTIVELIDAHDGFSIITNKITTSKSVTLLWVIAFLAFFLSAVLDNLTTAIVMVSLLRKLMPPSETRKVFAGIIIIAANAGGAWSPIGDVTTTMLWIGGQITTFNIIKTVFLPSLVSLVVPLLLVSRGLTSPPTPLLSGEGSTVEEKLPSPDRRGVGGEVFLFTGLGGLLFVPIFKTLTGLPPYMGMMLVLGVIWLISEFIHKEKDEEERKPLSAAHALSKIDTPSILFFLGILLAISALEVTHILQTCALWLDQNLKNTSLIVLVIGLISAVVDNVPLVAATMGMYDMNIYPTNHTLWKFLAYCSGTGGSILIIGSAAGVAVMGLERLDFIWYFKRISWLALIGYLAGALVYVVLN